MFRFSEERKTQVPFFSIGILKIKIQFFKLKWIYRAKIKFKNWNFISVKDYDEMQRVTRVRKPVNRFLLQNNQTGGIPCVVHFPGKNFVLYNYVGDQLYSKRFKPLEFKDSMTTLWTVSKLWK